MTANIDKLLGEVQARMNAVDSSAPKLSLPELRAAASMLEANGLAVDDAAFDNVLAGKLSAVDGQTELLDLLYLVKSLKPVKGKTESNPIGAVMPINTLENKITTESGEVWLRSGMVETDAANFDPRAGSVDSVIAKGSINLRQLYAGTWRVIEKVDNFIYAISIQRRAYKFDAETGDLLETLKALTDINGVGDGCFNSATNKWYVADYSSDSIKVYDSNFTYIEEKIVKQGGEALSIYGVCTDNTNFYIADSNLDELRKYDANFALVQTMSYSAIDNTMLSVAYHDNHLYFNGNSGQVLYKTDLSLNVVDSVSSKEVGTSYGITVDSSGIWMTSSKYVAYSFDLNLKGSHLLTRHEVGSPWTKGVCEYGGHYYVVYSNKTVSKISMSGVVLSNTPLPPEVSDPYGIVVRPEGVYILNSNRTVIKLTLNYAYESTIPLNTSISSSYTPSSMFFKNDTFYVSINYSANFSAPSMFSYFSDFSPKESVAANPHYNVMKSFDFYAGGVVFSGFSSSRYYLHFAPNTKSPAYKSLEVSTAASGIGVSPRSLSVLSTGDLMIADSTWEVPGLFEIKKVAGMKTLRSGSDSHIDYFTRIK